MGLVLNPFTGQPDITGSSAVTSVNGQTGDVVLDTDDIGEGVVNLYHTDERAQDAVGSILTDTAKIDFTYNDAGQTITANIVPASLVNVDINPAAAIDATKIADGSVSNIEFQSLDGITSNIQTQLNNKIETSEKGSNNGVATLDAGGKVPAAQLPNTVMEYKGNWNASTNTPTLADGIGNAGDVYRANVAGTQNFGSGPQTFAIGDFVIYSGTIWEKSINSNSVVSVNGQQGVVSLSTDNIAEGATNLYFTDERAQDAVGAIVVSSTKVSLTYSDATPSLTADIVANSLVNADINTAAAIDATKIADGSVTNTEFQYIGTLTSDAQTQLNNKANTTLNNLTTTAINTDLLPDTQVIRNIGSDTRAFGIIRAQNFIAPNESILFIGDTTISNATIVVANTLGLIVGQEVVGTGIPVGATISSIVVNTSITLDSNATATNIGVSFTAVYPGLFRSSNQVGTVPSALSVYRSGNTVNAPSGSITLRSGNTTGSGSSGVVTVRSGDNNNVAAGASGTVTVRSGNITNAGATTNTGNIAVQSGAQSGTGATGTITLRSGNVTSGTSGTTVVQTGNATTGSSGATSITTGNVTAGTNDSGRIDIITGTSAGGNRGLIQMSGKEINVLNNTPLKFFNAATTQAISFVAPTTITTGVTYTLPEDGTTSQVLSTNGAGLLSWITQVAGANTTLSNLTNPTSINQHLLPSAAFTRDIGSTSLPWNQIYGGTVGTPINASTILALQPRSLGGIFSHTDDSFILGNFGTVSGTSRPTALVTQNNTAADAVASQYVGIFTGNKTAGTGNSGKIEFRTGTSVGGVRGRIINNASAVELDAGTPLVMEGSSTGAITVQTQAAAGTYNFNLPTSAGTSGQPLLSGGGSGSPMMFGTLGMDAGGTNKVLTPVAGGIVYTDADSMEVSAAGTSGQYLKSNGATAPTFTSFITPNIQTFNFTGANVTYTTPANALYLEVSLVGGGAGGAGGGASGGGAGAGASGGVTDFMTAALSLLVRGSGGSNTGLSGTGGATTVNAPAVAVERTPGQNTLFTAVAAAIGTYAMGGMGGHTSLGWGGHGQPNAAGNVAGGFGAGGGGGGTNANVTGTDKFGGAGGGSGGYIKFLIPTPSSTYVVNVGDAGSGGVAGTNGFAGAAGTAGHVIIKAHFQ